jgi:hypothetical protein
VGVGVRVRVSVRISARVMVRVIRARVTIRVRRVGVRVRVRVTIDRFAFVCPPSPRQKGSPELAPALCSQRPSVGGRKSIRTRAKQGKETEKGTKEKG